MKSIFPYGYTSFADDRDTLADAEAGRLVLDNSRNPDGTYRPGKLGSRGYFREIADMASVAGLGIVPGSYLPYSERATPPPVGPEGPLTMPPVTVGPGPAAGPAGVLEAVNASMRQVGRSVGLPGWVPWLVAGAGAIGIGAVMFGSKSGRRKRARRRR